MLQAGKICSQLAQRRAAAATCSAAEHISTRCESTQANAQPEAGPGPGSQHQERTDLFLEMYRRHNSSLPNLEGQVIGARVFKTDRRYVWLDPGYNKYVKFARKALHLSQLLSSTEGGLRTSPEDFRIGDVLQFTVQELETPYGDMQLAVERPIEKDKFARVWEELRQAMFANTPVMGRVLNAVNGGFAVGTAGFVCFCPISQMEFLTATKIGILQPFQVVSMNKERKNVVLHDWRSVEKTVAKRERIAAYQADSMARNASAGRPGGAQPRKAEPRQGQPLQWDSVREEPRRKERVQQRVRPRTAAGSS